MSVYISHLHVMHMLHVLTLMLVSSALVRLDTVVMASWKVQGALVSVLHETDAVLITWKYCLDVNECSASPCDANAQCINTVGSFMCNCNEGFIGCGLVCYNSELIMVHTHILLNSPALS